MAFCLAGADFFWRNRFSILHFQEGEHYYCEWQCQIGARYLSKRRHINTQPAKEWRMENGKWKMENVVIQLLTASRCFDYGSQQTEQFLIVRVHRIELFFFHEFAVSQKLQPEFDSRAFLQRRAHFMDETAFAFGFLRGFDVRSKVGSVRQQPFADNELFPDFGQELVQHHYAQSEFVRLFEHDVFLHCPGLLVVYFNCCFNTLSCSACGCSL
jgi:hypothetical protein